MRFKPPELVLKDEWKSPVDKTNREENITTLTQLISTYKESMVLCIDSPWGTGKTTFIKMWRLYLKEEGFPTLYFNAWENDFSDDALVSLIGEIESGMNEFNIKEKHEADAKKYLKKTKKFGVEIIKKAIPALLKVATAGVLDIQKDIEQTLSDLAEQYAKDKIKDYENKKKSIEHFKEQLTNFTKVISDSDKSSEPKPLIFFIDELDRCRPTYAIELLEKAKHLFNVDGIVFVLAADKEQLGHSIRSVYGIGMNVDGYIKRFIDLTYQLPELPIPEFCDFLFKGFEIEAFLNTRGGNSQNVIRGLLNVFTDLFSVFKFSLRQQEQCFTQLSVVLRSFFSDRIHPIPLGYLIVLKSVNQNLYKKFIKKECTVEEIFEFIKEKYPGSLEFIDSEKGIEFEITLMSFHNEREDTNIHFEKKYDDFLKNKEANNSQKDRAKRALEFTKRYNVWHPPYYLKSLVKSIEITDRFW